MPQPALKVPFALDTAGKICYPTTAARHTQYKCPECARAVMPKMGMLIRWHFAHKAKQRCNPIAETTTHRHAKYLIAEMLYKKKQIIFTKTCDQCATIYYLVPPEAQTVFLEYSFGDCRPDIAFFTAHETAYAVEIVHTNPVSAEKSQTLKAHCRMWYALRADTIIQHRDVMQFALTAGSYKFTCTECAKRKRQAEQKEKERREREIAQREQHDAIMNAVTLPMTIYAVSGFVGASGRTFIRVRLVHKFVEIYTQRNKYLLTETLITFKPAKNDDTKQRNRIYDGINTFGYILGDTHNVCCTRTVDPMRWRGKTCLVTLDRGQPDSMHGNGAQLKCWSYTPNVKICDDFDETFDAGGFGAKLPIIAF